MSFSPILRTKMSPNRDEYFYKNVECLPALYSLATLDLSKNINISTIWIDPTGTIFV
ncbi:MAG: hypothetical protein RL259_600 [Bacteroidota bacterium]|jgi:hypothetical protein